MFALQYNAFKLSWIKSMASNTNGTLEIYKLSEMLLWIVAPSVLPYKLSTVEDKRKGTVMNRIAKGFSPSEIKALSQYFATLK